MSLIYSRKFDGQPLSMEDIAQRAPSVFSTTQAEHLSDRYGQVTTADAIGILADYGYNPVQAVQKRPRKACTAEHSHHLIAFSNRNSGMGGTDGESEVLLYNSHDGSSSLKMMAGYFRFVCSNGLIMGEGFNAKMRHYKSTTNGFEDMLKGILESLPTMLQRIRTMQETEVSYSQVDEFSNAALATRWSDKDVSYTQGDKGIYYDHVSVQDVSVPVRYEDKGLNAWNVFNVAQERIVRGGVRVFSVTDRSPHGTIRKARPIGSVKENVRVNQQLWDAAEDILMAA